MSDIDDGGPAFPRSGDNFGRTREGMSLRDWFAGQAMQAMVGSYRMTLRGKDESDDEREADHTYPHRDMMVDKNIHTGEYEGANEIADDAYVIADAMIAARKPPANPEEGKA